MAAIRNCEIKVRNFGKQNTIFCVYRRTLKSMIFVVNVYKANKQIYLFCYIIQSGHKIQNIEEKKQVVHKVCHSE